ncbi:MAG TPA: hypothetical protein VF785_02625 [Gemmatimonadaceae bacterium]|nr:hypothetical protein [Acidimicrobiia bacterium]
MPNPSAGEALRHAFADAFSVAGLMSTAERDRLRETVCAFVDQLKREGLPPERVIVELRSIADQARSGVLTESLIADAVRWCIERYYGTATAD